MSCPIGDEMGDDIPNGIKYLVADKMCIEIICLVNNDMRGRSIYKLSHN